MLDNVFCALLQFDMRKVSLTLPELLDFYIEFIKSDYACNIKH